MTEFIDTHSHLYEPEFDADRDQAMARAAEAGVRRLLLPAIDRESYRRMFDMCLRWPDRCFPMMGLHPTSVNDNPRWEEDLQLVGQMVENPPVERFWGIGEIGLDYYWSRDFRPQQREAFIRQLELSLSCGLPIAVHTRDAWDDMVEIVQGFAGRGLRGVFHAFSGSAEHLAELRRCGEFVFGIGGTVTFKKSAIAGLVRDMELSEMVLETDCPYLTPVPHRGERNESAYIPLICNRIAEIKETTAEIVARTTTSAAERIFFSTSAQRD